MADAAARLAEQDADLTLFMLKIAAILLGLQVIAEPVLAANYVCAADQTVGFFFNQSTNRWQTEVFNVKEEKYTLTTEDGHRVWKKLGDPLPMRWCRENETFIECDIGVMRVSLNKKNLRYQIIYEAGYVDGRDSPEDTPFIQIGRCSSM